MAQAERDLSPLELLHRAGQHADYLFAHHVGNSSLTPRQYMVLRAVSETHGLSQTAIMAATGIDRSSTADLVHRLVSRGLIKRRRTRRDARAYAVRLTNEGRSALAIGIKAARAADTALLSRVKPQLRGALLEALVLIGNKPGSERV